MAAKHIEEEEEKRLGFKMEEEEEEKRVRFKMVKHTGEKTTSVVFKRRRKTTQRDYDDYIRKMSRNSSSTPSWSNLLSELSEEINRYLPHMDQVRFRKVCKNWNSIGRVPPSKQIPFLFAWDVTTHCPNSRTCVIIDPSSCASGFNRTYYSIKPSPSILDEYTRACASRNGWLLLYKRNWLYPHLLPVFYFYSPFTGQIIDGFLPIPPPTNPYYKLGASFSSVPTSSDCTMFIFLYQESGIVIHTCRPGDKIWTTDTLSPHVYRYARRQCNVIYSNDNTFYCSYGYGELGTFNVSTRTWTSLITDPSIWPMSGWVHTVISSGGGGTRDEIYLFDTSTPDGNPASYRFYKLDQSVNHQKWVKLEAGNYSEDEAFFLGEVSLSVSIPIITEEMANHIYLYNLNNTFESYSLRTRQNYSSSLVSSLPQGHGNGDGFGVAYRKVWIEPPPILYS